MKTSEQWIPEGWAFTMLTSYARSSIKHPAKVRVVKLLAKLLQRKFMRFAASSGRFALDENDYIGWALLMHGSFEPLTIDLAIKLMRGSGEGIFLDIGAHHGLFTLAVGSTTDCEIVAIEASRENFQILLDNFQMNEELKVKLVNCAASSRETLLQLCVQDDEGRSAWTKVEMGPEVAGEPYVPGLRLGLILECLNVTRVRLLKIDVEGYELEVFRGLNWIGACRPKHVLMECNPNEKEKMKFLIEHGYSVRTIDNSGFENVQAFPEGNLLFSDTTQSD